MRVFTAFPVLVAAVLLSGSVLPRCNGVLAGQSMTMGQSCITGHCCGQFGCWTSCACWTD